MDKDYCFTCGHEKDVILKVIIDEKPKNYCVSCIVKRYGDKET